MHNTLPSLQIQAEIVKCYDFCRQKTKSHLSFGYCSVGRILTQGAESGVSYPRHCGSCHYLLRYFPSAVAVCRAPCAPDWLLPFFCTFQQVVSYIFYFAAVYFSFLYELLEPLSLVAKCSIF